MAKLDTRPARTDMTSREVSKVLCAAIGGFIDMADLESIREAVKWIAENEEVWKHFARFKLMSDMEALKPGGSKLV